MPAVLTESSKVGCAHGGSVQLHSTQSKLSVAGSKVLVAGDVMGATVSGCGTVTDPQTSTLQCATVASALGGVSTKLKVGGRGVLLETVSGQTSGTIGGTPQTWSVQSAVQTKLKAV